MIYLIGGPPKCGKTTLSKKILRDFGIPWISADTLQVVARKYMTKEDALKNFPWSLREKKTKNHNDAAYSKYTSKEIVKFSIIQARATYDAVDMFSICEMTDGNDYVIEGYQVTPELVNRLCKKYGAKNFRAVFLVKKDVNKLVVDFKKSTTPNDWILANTKQPETYDRIAKMIYEYGRYFEEGAKKYGFKVFNMDENFDARLNEIEKYLKG